MIPVHSGSFGFVGRNPFPLRILLSFIRAFVGACDSFEISPAVRSSFAPHFTR
jgi:hypothetical protein